MNKSLFVLLLAVSTRNSYVDGLGTSTRVTTSSTVTTRRPTTCLHAGMSARNNNADGSPMNRVGNYNRIVGSVVGRPKQKSLQRYGKEAGLPSYYEKRDEQVGNYGDMRFVGSVVGKQKQKSVQRYATQDAASSQTTPSQAGLPSYARKGNQVGNYGEKRVVGNVVGKQKHISLQRYDPKHAEGSQAASPAGLSSYSAGKDDQKLGNYGEERVSGSVVDSTVIGWPHGATYESVLEPEGNDGARHGSYLDALGGSDSGPIKKSYSPFGGSNSLNSPPTTESRAPSPFGGAKSIASTTQNALYSTPAFESTAPVDSVTVGNDGARHGSYLDARGESDSGPFKKTYSPFGGSKPVGSISPSSLFGAAKPIASTTPNALYSTPASESTAPVDSVAVGNDGARHGSYLDALGGSDSSFVKKSYSPFGGSKPVASTTPNSFCSPPTTESRAPSPFGASKPVASTPANSSYTSPTTQSNAPVEGNAASIPSSYYSRDDQVDNYGDMRVVGSVVGTQTHKSIKGYVQKHSGGAQAVPPQAGLPSYARKDDQVGNYGEKRVVGNVVGKQKHIYLQRYDPQRERLVAVEQSRLVAEERAWREAEEKVRRVAEQAQRQVELEARQKARLVAVEQARREAEEKTRLAVEEQAQRQAELEARQKARLAAVEQEAEEKARLALEEQAQRQVELVARQKARLVVVEQARREAEEKARLAVEEQAQRQAEEKARFVAVEQARRGAEEKARLARLPAYGDREDRVGNYGGKRVVGSVVGKQKHKSVQRYESEHAAGSQDSKAKSSIAQSQTGLPSYYASRDDQVGNYGEKRVVGNVVGKQKQKSLQRYDPAVSKTPSKRDFEQNEKVGNYGDKRVVGTVVKKDPAVDEQFDVQEDDVLALSTRIQNVIRERRKTRPILDFEARGNDARKTRSISQSYDDTQVDRFLEHEGDAEDKLSRTQEERLSDFLAARTQGNQRVRPLAGKPPGNDARRILADARKVLSDAKKTLADYQPSDTKEYFFSDLRPIDQEPQHEGEEEEEELPPIMYVPNGNYFSPESNIVENHGDRYSVEFYPDEEI